MQLRLILFIIGPQIGYCLKYFLHSEIPFTPGPLLLLPSSEPTTLDIIQTIQTPQANQTLADPIELAPVEDNYTTNSSQSFLNISSSSFSGVRVTTQMDPGKHQQMNLSNMLKLSIYYFLLYFFTVVYNVANKVVLEKFSYPFTVATLQVMIGIPVFLPFWLMKFPHFFKTLDYVHYHKIAACHGFGNAATVMALNSASVSFVHVIKSAEPIFSAILSLFVMNSKLSILTYLSLLPIVIGVALASLKELNFTWMAFLSAMMSNLCYQSRMVFSKAALIASHHHIDNSNSNNNHHNVSKLKSEDSIPISAVNTFRIITVFACLQLLPVTIFFERQGLYHFFIILVSASSNLEYRKLLINLIISGVSFYIYNEISFWILDLVHPVTHAVGNTIKRIVLILASVMIFHTKVSGLGMFGSFLAVIGSMIYALSQQHHQPSVSQQVILTPASSNTEGNNSP
jgi:solute carrier family 35, member E1